METVQITHHGLVNQGGFFSPYYLFDLLSRQHADELDPTGRETYRRMLRRPYLSASNRFANGSSPAEAWQAWYSQLFQALGYLEPGCPALTKLEAPIPTPRHGLVPLTHAVNLTGNDPQVLEAPLVFVDLHGFCVNPDRSRYSSAGNVVPGGFITDEAIARAVELALDNNETRWAILGFGDSLRLYRRGGSVARQYLEVNFPALFDGDRDDEWAAFWGLFRYQAFVPEVVTGKSLLDRVLEESQRHASRIAEDLRENVISAVEALIQGVLDEPANKHIINRKDTHAIRRLFVESLYFLYRLLFVLYAESRDLLPVTDSLVYRDTYSMEHLREMVERPTHTDDAEKTYFIETLRTLFNMLQNGYPAARQKEPQAGKPQSAGARASAPFTISAFNGQLFNPDRTRLLNQCHLPDRVMRNVVQELSLSLPKKRNQPRERYSYADLGVDQLGSIYEGLLVYEPTIIDEDTVVAKVKEDERLVSRAQAVEYGLPIIEGSEKRAGSFVLRLWGGRRKGSGSYYTPQEITSFLVKEALEPLVEPIIAGCGERDRRGRPKRSPEEILELKVCDPAMGSGAFLIQACRYLAEAYGQARVAAGEDDDGRISQEEFSHHKRRVAERCLYGVDLNPLAVELAKVSLWLETLSKDKPSTFLDAHLRCGNSLVGVPLHDQDGQFSVVRLRSVPDDAYKAVSKEATKEEKTAAAALAKRNRDEIKRIEKERSGQGYLPGVDWGELSLVMMESTLTDTLTRRLDLERTDEDLSTQEAIALVHSKEALFDQLQNAPGSRYRQVRRLCDLWCAVWFWPEPGSVVYLEKDWQRRRVIVPEAPSTQAFLELSAFLLDTDSGSLTEQERSVYLDIAEVTTNEQLFFHWELEFPEVWRGRDGHQRQAGGFDAIVGNPPWETIKPNSKEFWSNYNPLFRKLAKQKANQYAAVMRTDPKVDRAWRSYETAIARTGNFLKKSGGYTHQGRGDQNTYKLFTERGLSLLRQNGGLDLVLPSGIYTDLGTRELRELIFATCNLHYMLAFVNERFIFPAVHHAFRFVLLSARQGGLTETFRVLFRLNPQNAVRPEEIAPLLADLQPETIEIDIKDVQKFSPTSLSIMEFKNQRELNLVAGIYHDHPMLRDDKPNIWNLIFTSEFHMTNDAKVFRDSVWLANQENIHKKGINWVSNDGGNWLSLYEGKIIYQFTDTYEEHGLWVHESDVWKSKVNQKGKLTYRLVASSTNEITLISTVLPPGSPTGNSLAVLIGENEIDFAKQLFACACMNSFVLNFILRKKVQANLNMFIVEQIPLPRPSSDNILFLQLVCRAAKLICSSEKFIPVWEDVAETLPKLLPIVWEDSLSVKDPLQRAQLRSEIDAFVADVYGVTEPDFAYILSTFPLLDREQPPLFGEIQSTVTRDLAMLELFKLRGKIPPSDIVAFFDEAEVDVHAVTGPIVDLQQRVEEALRLGAVAYLPSRKDEEEADEEMEEERSEED
jgi:hypothetical protein